jgi:dTDP-4-dehydrorhamnose 3,5-epimerase
MFRVRKTELEGVLFIEGDVWRDQRGHFSELLTPQLNFIHVVQVNHSFSKRGVLRGLHYQLPPMAQGKLVTVLEGRIYDVAVDIRKGSPWYASHVGVELELGKSLWIPRGFAHGFQALEDSIVVYMVDAPYSPENEAGVSWNDQSINVKWPLPPILSDRDLKWPPLERAKNNFVYEKY